MISVFKVYAAKLKHGIKLNLDLNQEMVFDNEYFKP